MDDDRRSHARRYDDSVVTPREHEDLKQRVSTVEGKLDRITWLIIATLATTLYDVFRNLNH